MSRYAQVIWPGVSLSTEEVEIGRSEGQTVPDPNWRTQDTALHGHYATVTSSGKVFYPTLERFEKPCPTGEHDEDCVISAWRCPQCHEEITPRTKSALFQPPPTYRYTLEVTEAHDGGTRVTTYSFPEEDLKVLRERVIETIRTTLVGRERTTEMRFER